MNGNTALTPGHARGVVWSGPVRLHEDTLALDAGRASIIGPVQRVADTPDVPFLWRTNHVDVGTLLALALQGLAGIILVDDCAVGRHALTMALGLGLPVSRNPEVMCAQEGSSVCIGGPFPGPHWEITPPHGAVNVRPASMWRPGDEIELVGGQDEELRLVCDLLGSTRASAIGLLRIEHLLLIDPQLDQTGLVSTLSRMMRACSESRFAVRLAQWCDDKPCPRNLVLSDAREQVSAIETAAKATDHPRVTIVCAPTDPKPTKLPWGLLVEHPESSIPDDREIWVGMGDLCTHTSSPIELKTLIEEMCRRAPAGAHLCGLAGPWDQR